MCLFTFHCPWNHLLMKPIKNKGPWKKSMLCDEVEHMNANVVLTSLCTKQPWFSFHVVVGDTSVSESLCLESFHVVVGDTSVSESLCF
jgi:hypothetical protein